MRNSRSEVIPGCYVLLPEPLAAEN